MPRKTGRTHSWREKYKKTPKYPKSTVPRTERAPRRNDRDYKGKRIRSKGKFPTLKDRIRRRLEVAKEKRARP